MKEVSNGGVAIVEIEAHRLEVHWLLISMLQLLVFKVLNRM